MRLAVFMPGNQTFPATLERFVLALAGASLMGDIEL